MKRTAWFPVSTPPVRSGVYEVLFMWCGKQHFIQKREFHKKHGWLMKYGELTISCFYNDRWRGLAKQPKGRK